MNKIKKILLNIIAIMTAAIFIISGTANAEGGLDDIKNDTNENESVSVKSTDLLNRRDLYCVEKDAPLNGTKTYTVEKYIKIEGNTAWNTDGESVTSNSNGVLAYILSRKLGYNEGQNDFKIISEAQKSIWAYSNTWYSNVGSELGIDWTYENNNGDFGQNLINEGEEYANSIGDVNTKITDNTDKDNISTTAYNEDGKSYVRVGPFNWNFEGTLSEITIYDENNSEYSDVRYSKYEGNDEVFINASDISSDANFYITVEANSEHTKIKGISAKGSIDTGNVYTAEIWFLSHSGQQKLILVNTDTKPTESEINADFDYDITLTKNLEIYKVDSRNEKLPLVGVGFILQNKEMNKYVKQTNGTLSYVDNKNDATEFMTDSDGKIKIELCDKKNIFINGIKIKKLSELLGNINTVIFTPDDINILKGGPQNRRRFLDIMISQLRPNYMHILNSYLKTIEQRNKYLRQIKEERKDENLLDIWDEKLAEYAIKICEYRQEFIEKITNKIEKIHNNITNEKEKIEIEYITECSNKENYLKLLKERRKLDIIKGFTTKGVHRDDFVIYINKKEINIYGSQGQNRTAMLSLKLSELQVIKDEIGEYPILLLDDFMSELDSTRRKNFLENIKDTQVIITGTEKLDIENLEYLEYNVSNGKIFKQK